MPSLTKRINALKKCLKPQDANRALADALTYANPDETDPIASEILNRLTKHGCKTLIQKYHKLNHTTKKQIINIYPAQKQVINPALNNCCKSINQNTRLNAIKIIGLQKNLACLSALIDNLCGETKSLSHAAAEVLYLITHAYFEKNLSPAPTPSEIDQLDKAISIAADTYPKHRQHAVLMAAALLTNKPGPRLARWLNDENHPSRMSMRGVLKHINQSAADDSLLAWLSIDMLSQQVLNRINQIGKSPETLPKLLAQSHLTKIPAQNRRLARLDERRPCTVNSENALKKLNDTDQARLPRWISVIPLKNQDRINRFADGLSFNKPLARLINLKYLIDSIIESNDNQNNYARCANEVVASYCFDAEQNIARIALHHCIHHKNNLADLPKLLKTLALSPHTSVRRIAKNHIVEISFQQVWNLWENKDTNPDTQRIITRQFIAANQIYFINELRKKLTATASPDRRVIMQTIRMCTALKLLPEIELELLARAKSEDPYIAAASVSALGNLKDSRAATQIIQAAIFHKDSRVRANAIELIDESRITLLHDIREEIEHISVFDDNRPRANAINALSLLDSKWAAKRIDMMLADRRPLHRISAMWLIESKLSTAHSRAIAKIIHSDPNEKVRESARKTAKKLLNITKPLTPKIVTVNQPSTQKLQLKQNLVINK